MTRRDTSWELRVTVELHRNDEPPRSQTVRIGAYDEHVPLTARAAEAAAARSARQAAHSLLVGAFVR